MLRTGAPGGGDGVLRATFSSNAPLAGVAGTAGSSGATGLGAEPRGLVRAQYEGRGKAEK